MYGRIFNVRKFYGHRPKVCALATGLALDWDICLYVARFPISAIHDIGIGLNTRANQIKFMMFIPITS